MATRRVSTVEWMIDLLGADYWAREFNLGDGFSNWELRNKLRRILRVAALRRRRK